MSAIPSLRLPLVALAAALLIALTGIGCGGDDDSDDDSAPDSGTETVLEEQPTQSGESDEPDPSEEGEDAILSYRVAGTEAGPGELGLVIDAEGRGTYAIGQGREIEFELSPDELVGLRRTFDRIGFADLPERIEPKDGEGVAGAAEVEVGHEGKVVREVPGSPTSPLAPIHAAVAQIISKHAVKAGTLSPADP